MVGITIYTRLEVSLRNTEGGQGELGTRIRNERQLNAQQKAN